MIASIRASTFKDIPALTIESTELTAQFLPGIGSNLCSLRARRTGKELMIQRPGAIYKQGRYDSDYVADGECAGMDDMLPSIDRCFYESPPWRGTAIPDHGELWSLPWTAGIEGESIHFSVDGIRFPYRLHKRVSFSEPGTLRIEYTLNNRAPFAFDFLWAAHPMFALEEGARLALPDGIGEVVTALRFNGTLGNYGTISSWPIATDASGNPIDLRRPRTRAAGDAVKYFVRGRMPEGWCSLTYPESHLRLILRFPADRVPYLGILVNEGGWQGLYNIFLEPSTAALDRLDVARLRGEFSTIEPNGEYRWYMEIAIEPLST